MNSRSMILKIEKVDTFMEDYCCVVSFASDLSPSPDSYLLLTRQSTEITGGDPIENFDWDLQIDYEGEIRTLTSYRYVEDKLLFIFDDGNFNLEMQINEKMDLQPWLDFIFKK